jgi:hypothetical protein
MDDDWLAKVAKNGKPNIPSHLASRIRRRAWRDHANEMDSNWVAKIAK